MTLLLALCMLLFACDRQAPTGNTETTSANSGAEGTAQQTTVAEANKLGVGTYVTLVGSITAHQSEDYYTFADSTGEMRVQIGSDVLGGQQVDPKQRVQLMGEIDSGTGGRYLWVKSLRAM